jgi:hypothetical protein
LRGSWPGLLVFCDDRRGQRRQPIEMAVQTNAGDMVRVTNGIEDPGTGSNTTGRALMKSYKYSTFTLKF